MRAIHLVQLDKVRPAVILTRPHIIEKLVNVTVAPITTTRRGIRTEVPVGRRNGLDHDSVINLDNVTTIAKDRVLDAIGRLLRDDEIALRDALLYAYDLD